MVMVEVPTAWLSTPQAIIRGGSYFLSTPMAVESTTAQRLFSVAFTFIASPLKIDSRQNEAIRLEADTMSK
jgi:hypothetical protein